MPIHTALAFRHFSGAQEFFWVFAQSSLAHEVKNLNYTSLHQTVLNRLPDLVFRLGAGLHLTVRCLSIYRFSHCRTVGPSLWMRNADAQGKLLARDAAGMKWLVAAEAIMIGLFARSRSAHWMILPRMS